MIRATIGILAGSAGGFDADYQAILDYATTQGYTLPSASQQALQNQLVVDLKSAGIWSKLDIFYVCATDANSDFASINWKNPNNFEIIEVNSPTFTTNEGFYSDGVSAYLDTQYNLSTDSVNFTQDDGCVFIFAPKTGNSETKYYYGTETTLYLSYRLNNARMWHTSSSNYIGASLDTGTTNPQIHFSNRTASASVNSRTTNFINGITNTATGATVSSALLSLNMNFLRGGGLITPINWGVGIIGLGSSLNSVEMSAVENAIYTNYFASL